MSLRLLSILLGIGLGTVAFAQSLPDFPRGDNDLLIEFDRYSLKLAQRDPTPMVRIYGSGRVEIYRSVFKPDQGIYEVLLSPDEVDAIVMEIVGSQLDAVRSEDLGLQAESAELSMQESSGLLYYTSDATVTELNVHLPGRQRSEPLMFENLHDTASRHPDLLQIQDLAKLQRRLLELAARRDKVLVGNARSLDTLD